MEEKIKIKGEDYIVVNTPNVVFHIIVLPNSKIRIRKTSDMEEQISISPIVSNAIIVF